MTLKIVKASDPLPVAQIVVCLYSQPGLGKTTLGFTAADPLLLDCDKGAYRAANRKDSVTTPTWNAIANIEVADLAAYKTVIIDTAGRALDLLTADLIATNPKLGRGGALTLQGYGELKSKFGAYLRMLRTHGKDVVLIAHMDEQRNGDDTIERLDVQGGSKTEIYKSADAMGRVIIRGDKRFIDFNPRENSFGKNPCNLPLIPFTLENSACLAEVIATIKQRLNAHSETEKAARAAQEASVGAAGQRTAVSDRAASQPQTTGTGPQTRATATPPAAKKNGHAAQDDGKHIRGTVEMIYTRDAKKKPLTTSKGSPFVKLVVDGVTYRLFDNFERVVVNEGISTTLRMFGILGEAKPSDPIEFTYEVSDFKGQEMRNIKNVMRVGRYEWLPDGTPAVRRDAPLDDDADIPF